MKSEFIQIRISAQEKAILAKRADKAGLDLSNYLLSGTRRDVDADVQRLVRALSTTSHEQPVLAELNDVLSSATGAEVTSLLPPDFGGLGAFHCNYIAAMVEYAAARSRASAPRWVRDVVPLSEPWFASTLLSLRPHLLRSSPPPFRSRNIFIDASLGGRV